MLIIRVISVNANSSSIRPSARMPFFTIGILFQDVCVQNDGMEIKVNRLTNVIIAAVHWNTTVFMHNLSVHISNTVFADRSLDDRAMAFFRNLHKSSLGECPDILLINHKVGYAFLFGYSNLRSTSIPLLVMSRLDEIETKRAGSGSTEEQRDERQTENAGVLWSAIWTPFTKVYTSSVPLVLVSEVNRDNLIDLSVALLCLAHFSVFESIFHPQSAQKMLCYGLKGLKRCFLVHQCHRNTGSERVS